MSFTFWIPVKNFYEIAVWKSRRWKNNPQNYLCCFLLWREIKVEDGASGDAHEDAHQTYLNPNFREQERNNYLEDIHTFYWTVLKEVIERKKSRCSRKSSEFIFCFLLWIPVGTFPKVTDTMSCTIHGGSHHCVPAGDGEKVGVSIKCVFFGTVTKHALAEEYAFGSGCLMSQRDVRTSANKHEYFKGSYDSRSHPQYTLFHSLVSSHVTAYFTLPLLPFSSSLLLVHSPSSSSHTRWISDFVRAQSVYTYKWAAFQTFIGFFDTT